MLSIINKGNINKKQNRVVRIKNKSQKLSVWSEKLFRSIASKISKYNYGQIFVGPQ